LKLRIQVVRYLKKILEIRKVWLLSIVRWVGFSDFFNVSIDAVFEKNMACGHTVSIVDFHGHLLAVQWVVSESVIPEWIQGVRA
jgi:hypothetical protein